MSALIKNLKLIKFINKNPAAIYTVTRNHWNKDFKPGKFPETEEERKAAAKKYNLLPEEYEPYPDDGVNSRGDYPHLPDIPVERRDPYYPWDFPELKRNFQEPVHAELEMYDETRYGTPAPLRFPLGQQALMFFGVMSGFFFLYWWLEDKKMFRPASPKQLPEPGKVHYTFDPK